jgi:diguanylate cyclase (GGDEF)-like protein
MSAPAPLQPTPAERLHQVLMPDYGRAATWFWWAVVAGGSVALLWALADLVQRPALEWLQIGAGVLLAVGAGMFPVRVPGTKQSFIASEVFIFGLLLLYGPAPATLAVAVEALVGTLRTSKRLTSRLFSPANSALAMAVTGSLLHLALGRLATAGFDGAAPLIAAMLVFAVLYFAVGIQGVAGVTRLKRGEPFWQVQRTVADFRWIAIAYAGSAGLASLLFVTYRQQGAGVLMVMLPILLMLLASLHFYYRQQEAGEEAAAREAALSARHLGELQHMAFHDALTGLPNRRRFMECLDSAVTRHRGDASHRYAVMFLDFDRFKLVNDSLGHNAGDELLALLARRLQSHVRPADVVARLGGDEFAILVERIEHDHEAVQLAERLMAALREPLTVGGVELICSASVGITFSTFGYTQAAEVLRDADTAMYKAKSHGKAGWAVFDSTLHTAVSRRLRLEGELRNAIEAGELAVVYQPLIDLDSGKPTGFEALVRWQHPSDGLLAPAAFLPIAEETGLMLKLSDFVIHCACRQLRQWQAVAGTDPALTISVNVSANDLAQGSFSSRVAQALVESGCAPGQLTLELTENILVSQIGHAMATLQQLRALGVRLAVDDFGTGYSSLSHLARLPVDSLKIDRSFVAQLGHGADEAEVVRAIIQLGRALRKSVVAEGIETAAQMAQLREMGCSLGQGFHLAAPLSGAEAAALLARGGGSQAVH